MLRNNNPSAFIATAQPTRGSTQNKFRLLAASSMIRIRSCILRGVRSVVSYVLLRSLSSTTPTPFSRFYLSCSPITYDGIRTPRKSHGDQTKRLVIYSGNNQLRGIDYSDEEGKQVLLYCMHQPLLHSIDDDRSQFAVQKQPTTCIIHISSIER